VCLSHGAVVLLVFLSGYTFMHMKARLASTILAVSLFIAASCMSQTHYTESDRRNKFTDSELNFLGIRLGSSSMQDVVKQLGSAEAMEFGDAGDYEKTLCYLAPDDSAVLFKTGEMGGSIDVIEIVVARRSEIRRYLPKCSRPKHALSDNKLMRGLKLGADVNALRAAFGRPQEDSRGTILYYFSEEKQLPVTQHEPQGQSKTDQPQAERFDVSDFVEAHTRNGKLVYFSWSRIEST
jgi:hypothetical protein